MEQKDYLMREIEKIGAMFNAIRQKLLGGSGDSSWQNAFTAERAKGELSVQLNTDIQLFLKMSMSDTKAFLLNMEGFTIENIEILADLIAEIGLRDDCREKKQFLEKSVQLYDLCNAESNTYSIARQTKMRTLMNVSMNDTA